MSDRRAQLETLLAFAAAELAQLPAEAPPAPVPLLVYMTPTEFARYIRLSRATIRKMIDEGLPCIQVRSRCTRIRVVEAEAWLAARSAKPARSATVAARKGRLQ